MLKKRLTQILQTWVSPTLTREGFRKKINVYERRFGTMGWIIDVQWSPFKNAVKSEFTLNCGVYVAGVTSKYFNRPDSKQTQLTDCCIQSRVGMLTQSRTDKWWSLQASDEPITVDEIIGEDMHRRICSDCLPFLKRFTSLADVLAFLITPRQFENKHVWPQSEAISLCFAASIASQLGHPVESEKFIKNATEKARGSPIEHVVLRMRDDLHTTQDRVKGKEKEITPINGQGKGSDQRDQD